MKIHKPKTSGINKTRQKKRAKIEGKIFFNIIVIGLVYYIFFESKSIGGDYRYDLFVFWMPTLIGFFLSIKYFSFSEYWSSLIPDIKKEKRFILKIFYPIFLTVITFTYCVILYWMPCNVIWDCINKYVANKNRTEVFIVPVTQFKEVSKSPDRIDFYMNNKFESIPVASEVIKPYLGKNPKNYKIKIKVKKGIWNYYVLEDFDIL